MVVNDRPKPMVMIDGRPFIDFVVEPFVRQGIRRVILCTGYKGEHFENWYASRNRPYELLFSPEESPLGTAGAISNAAGLIRNNPFLVVNGDSLCETNPEQLLAFHAAKGGCATLTLTPASRRTDVGFVTMNQNSRLSAFAEKQPGGMECFHNAGIYVFERSILGRLPASRPCSLETDLLPHLLEQGVYGFACNAPLYDIGTPERLEQFRAYAESGSMMATKRASSYESRGAVDVL
jgi:NDP-sugar pyrophosphorylase family protein